MENLLDIYRSGWCFQPYPSEKYESIGMMNFSIYGKIKHVPNHRPGITWDLFTRIRFGINKFGIHLVIYLYRFVGIHREFIAIIELSHEKLW